MWTGEDELNFQMGDMNGETGNEPVKDKPEICMDCSGIVCVDVEGDRVLIGGETGRVIVTYDNVKSCTMKTGEEGPKHLLLKDIIWEATTPLEGWPKHMAFIERVEGKK